MHLPLKPDNKWKGACKTIKPLYFVYKKTLHDTYKPHREFAQTLILCWHCVKHSSDCNSAPQNTPLFLEFFGTMNLLWKPAKFWESKSLFCYGLFWTLFNLIVFPFISISNQIVSWATKMQFVALQKIKKGGFEIPRGETFLCRCISCNVCV